MMQLLTKKDLLSLEQYAENRDQIRADAIATKLLRNVYLGEHINFMFENLETVKYQIQEMLRIEKIFEPSEIQDELDVYTPLIPDGHNLKATMMIQYDDVEQRKEALANMIGIEKKIYFQVKGADKVYPICNEDLDRETDDKTSSVHFVRFEFTSAMVKDFINGSEVVFGSEHPAYQMEMILTSAQQKTLSKDFDL
jgi:hypothetical protein